MGFGDSPGVQIILLNLRTRGLDSRNFVSIAGDARDMRQFADGDFDIVFSNSVIEHVGCFADQRRMAEEVRRIGRRYFVQTPNRYFPIEPHFLVPMFQFLPRPVQVFLATRFALGWYRRFESEEKARRELETIRLLTLDELMALFPRAHVYEERWLGLAKSYVVYGGWSRAETKAAERLFEPHYA